MSRGNSNKRWITGAIRALGWCAIPGPIAATCHRRRIIQHVTVALLLIACGVSSVQAQSQTWAPVVITQPIVDSLDENHVSILTGKVLFTIPAIKLGDVSFTPASVSGTFSRPTAAGLMDGNYGRIATCMAMDSTVSQTYSGTSECSVPSTTGAGLQAIYGQERATFTLANGQYSAYALDGSTFVDNGSTCTWTKRDGTQIVFAAYHVSGDPRCYSSNISQITRPDGRIATYYYYGSTTLGQPSPILSIATNSGYMLKYNYSGTPTFGAETSVVAINRAFERCDPSATACTLTGTWPTAIVSWQDKMVSTSDDFIPVGANYNPYRHSIFTIEAEAHKKYVFELDSYDRVISYQPPQATGPVYFYNVCSRLSDGTTLRNCFGYTTWVRNPYPVFQIQPLMFDLVSSSTRNGQTWSYSYGIATGTSYGSWSTWVHGVANPLGKGMSAGGNATPGQEIHYGPTDFISHYDGTIEHFERSVRNYITTQQTPAGITTIYDYGYLDTPRGNLLHLQRNPISGGTDHTLVQSAVYPDTCTNIITCNKPTSVTDANNNTANFTYDPTHGGVLTTTGPAVNGIQPQTRYSYVQRYAWYVGSSGVMTRETRPIWVLQNESSCRTGPANTSGPGCVVTNDEVVTTYEYGPDSGPNNLSLRGKSVTADGQTLRTCYGHDKQGNKIWEALPNASRSSCPDY